MTIYNICIRQLLGSNNTDICSSLLMQQPTQSAPFITLVRLRLAIPTAFAYAGSFSLASENVLSDIDFCFFYDYGNTMFLSLIFKVLLVSAFVIIYLISLRIVSQLLIKYVSLPSLSESGHSCILLLDRNNKDAHTPRKRISLQKGYSLHLLLVFLVSFICALLFGQFLKI